MRKRRTQEEFEQDLKSILPDIEVIGKFTNVNTKIKCKCLIHDYEFEAYPSNLLHGHGCKKCGSIKQSKKQTKTHEQFVEDLKKVNPDIEVIGRYTGIQNKVKVKCLIDGHEWESSPRNLLRGRRCAVCTNHKTLTGVNDVATTRPDLVKYFKNKDEATMYSAGSEKIVELLCPKCGYTKKMKIAALSCNGFLCNDCYEQKYGRRRVSYRYWNVNTMAQYLSENYPGYELLDIDRFKKDSKRLCLKAFIKCPNPDHAPYWVYWTNVLSGYECLQCSLLKTQSKGERMAQDILEKHNIKFIPEKRFNDCRDINTLPFDFYTPDYNLIIEIMGEQHEKPIEVFGGVEGFQKCIKHDKIKRDYLSRNNINIIDIWYYEFDNMEELILNKIKQITIQN